MELSSEGAGGRPAEIVGDHDDLRAPPEADHPDPIAGAPVGADFGMLHLHDNTDNAGLSMAGPTAQRAVEGRPAGPKALRYWRVATGRSAGDA
ncbi:MAG: hypothetical protein ACRDWV_10985, partial [Acidimicrobiales bacterium]